MCKKHADGDEPNVYFSVTFRNSKLSAKAVGQQQTKATLFEAGS